MRLGSFNAVPMAVLFLVAILFAIYYALPTHRSGFYVQIATNTCTCYPADRAVVLKISNNGQLSINSEPVERRELAARLAQIYSTRAARILFLSADREVPFQWAADVLNTVQNAKITSLPGTVSHLKETANSDLNIQIQLVTPGAVATPCASDCYNWGKHGFPVAPATRL